MKYSDILAAKQPDTNGIVECEALDEFNTGDVAIINDEGKASKVQFTSSLSTVFSKRDIDSSNDDYLSVLYMKNGIYVMVRAETNTISTFVLDDNGYINIIASKPYTTVNVELERCHLCKFSSNKFALYYYDNGYYVRAGTISDDGSIISLGPSVSFTSFIAAAPLTETKQFCLRDQYYTGSDYYLRGCVLTVNDNLGISIGAATNITNHLDDNRTKNASVSRLSFNKVMVTHSYFNNVYGRIITINNDNSLSLGPETILYNTYRNSHAPVTINQSKVIFFIFEDSDNTLYCYPCTIGDDNSISKGSSYTFPITRHYLKYWTKFAQNSVVIFTVDANGYSSVCTLNNDDSISFSSLTNLGYYNNIKAGGIVFDGIDSVLSMGVTGGEGYYNLQKAQTTLTTTNIVGIAQHYAEAGSIIKIRTTGPVDKNITNLEPNKVYYVAGDGSLTTEDTGYKIGTAAKNDSIVL